MTRRNPPPRKLSQPAMGDTHLLLFGESSMGAMRFRKRRPSAVGRSVRQTHKLLDDCGAARLGYDESLRDSKPEPTRP